MSGYAAPRLRSRCDKADRIILGPAYQAMYLEKRTLLFKYLTVHSHLIKFVIGQYAKASWDLE